MTSLRTKRRNAWRAKMQAPERRETFLGRMRAARRRKKAGLSPVSPLEELTPAEIDAELEPWVNRK